MRSVPCSVYRGGTSRGLFFLESDLPKELSEKKQIFMDAIDTTNPSQVNGLGGSTPHTSKIAVIGYSDDSNIDATYTFYQASVGGDIIDDRGTCGNLMAAVGAFVIEEGIKEISENSHYNEVLVHNTNIDRLIRITVPLKNNSVDYTGDFKMKGVIQPGSKISVNIIHPGGENVGNMLPTGKIQTIDINGDIYHYSTIDMVNPFVFVSGKQLGLSAEMNNNIFSSRREILDKLEKIRTHASVKMNLTKNIDEARKLQYIPKIALVWKVTTYKTTNCDTVKEEEVDIVAKMFSMGKVHRTFAVSGLFSLSAASIITGTIPNQCMKVNKNSVPQEIRIGHPEGVVPIQIRTHANGEITHVGIERTAKRIMKGEIFYY